MELANRNTAWGREAISTSINFKDCCQGAGYNPGSLKGTRAACLIPTCYPNPESLSLQIHWGSQGACCKRGPFHQPDYTHSSTPWLFGRFFPTLKLHDLSHSLNHRTSSTWTDLARSPLLEGRVAYSILVLPITPAWITLCMLFHACVDHSVGHISGSRTAVSQGWRVYDLGRCFKFPSTGL